MTLIENFPVFGEFFSLTARIRTGIRKEIQRLPPNIGEVSMHNGYIHMCVNILHHFYNVKYNVFGQNMRTKINDRFCMCMHLYNDCSFLKMNLVN